MTSRHIRRASVSDAGLSSPPPAPRRSSPPPTPRKVPKPSPGGDGVVLSQWTAWDVVPFQMDELVRYSLAPDCCGKVVGKAEGGLYRIKVIPFGKGVLPPQGVVWEGPSDGSLDGSSQGSRYYAIVTARADQLSRWTPEEMERTAEEHMVAALEEVHAECEVNKREVLLLRREVAVLGRRVRMLEEVVDGLKHKALGRKGFGRSGSAP